MKKFFEKYLMPNFLKDKPHSRPLVVWTYLFLIFWIYWTITGSWDNILVIWSVGIMVFVWITVPISQKWW